MSNIIESLESRMLLTASATQILMDEAGIKGAGLQAKADLKTALAQIVVDDKMIAYDVKTVRPNATQKAALKVLLTGEASLAAKYKNTINKILSKLAKSFHRPPS